MTGTMRALVLRRHGDVEDVELVEDFPRPELRPGHVIVRVMASSFNHHDMFTVRGMPGIEVPMPLVLGMDIVGEIVACHEDVRDWNVGDRVLVNPLDREHRLMGELNHGGMAEYCGVAADQLVAVPDTVSWTDAASLPVAYGAAHRMIVGTGAVNAGDKVLVLGASGGVGTASIIILKALGAHVVAATSSDDKGKALLDLGADEYLDYTQVPFDEWVREHHGKPNRFSDETGMDVIINNTGGDTWAPTLRSAKRGGRILVCGATAGYDPREDLRYVFSFELKIIGSNAFTKHDLTALLAMVADGSVKPLISEVLDLDDALEGLRRLRDREALGKIVVRPGPGA